MLRFAVYVSLALILLQTTFSEENPKDCKGEMGILEGDGCPREVRNILYKEFNETIPKLKYNCTLEGVAHVSASFNDETAYQVVYGNLTGLKQLWYKEENTFGPIYRDPRWGSLNISSFIKNATTTWNLTSESVQDKTKVGCYFDVDFNFTLVCAFA